MKILIEGIGGIGGILAASLLESGIDTTLLTANQQITDTINNDGIKYTINGKHATVKGTAYTTVQEITDTKFDVILLVMKADGVIEAATNSLPLLTDDGYMVTFQNGIVEDDVIAIVGKEKLVSGIIGWGGTMHGPGDYEKTSPGSIHLGELDGSISERCNKLAKMLESVDHVIVTDNIRGALWSKLAINAAINSLGVVTGMKLGDILKSSKQNRTVLLRIYSETVDTASANDIKLEKIAANPYLLYLPANSGTLKSWFKDQLVKIVGRKYKNIRSSSLQSILRGKKTEVDYLNGYVAKIAKTKAVPVPFNNAMIEMIHEIEAGKRQMEENNMAILYQKATESS